MLFGVEICVSGLRIIRNLRLTRIEVGNFLGKSSLCEAKGFEHTFLVTAHGRRW